MRDKVEEPLLSWAVCLLLLLLSSKGKKAESEGKKNAGARSAVSIFSPSLSQRVREENKSSPAWSSPLRSPRASAPERPPGERSRPPCGSSGKEQEREGEGGREEGRGGDSEKTHDRSHAFFSRLMPSSRQSLSLHPPSFRSKQVQRRRCGRRHLGRPLQVERGRDRSRARGEASRSTCVEVEIEIEC